jgi:hypothetical protein
MFLGIFPDVLLYHSCMLHSRCSQSSNPSTTSQSNSLRDSPRSRKLTFVIQEITPSNISNNNTKNTGINALNASSSNNVYPYVAVFFLIVRSFFHCLKHICCFRYLTSIAYITSEVSCTLVSGTVLWWFVCTIVHLRAINQSFKRKSKMFSGSK